MDVETHAQGRQRVVALVFAIAIAGLLVPRASQAQTGTYGGEANTDLVHVEALDIPEALQLAEVGVAPSSAVMSSEGVDGVGTRFRGRPTLMSTR